jgi:hypothetical protein
VDLLMVKPWDDTDLRMQVRRLLREDGWEIPEPPPAEERSAS